MRRTTFAAPHKEIAPHNSLLRRTKSRRAASTESDTVELSPNGVNIVENALLFGSMAEPDLTILDAVNLTIVLNRRNIDRSSALHCSTRRAKFMASPPILIAVKLLPS